METSQWVCRSRRRRVPIKPTHRLGPALVFNQISDDIGDGSQKANLFPGHPEQADVVVQTLACSSHSCILRRVCSPETVDFHVFWSCQEQVVAGQPTGEFTHLRQLTWVKSSSAAPS